MDKYSTGKQVSDRQPFREQEIREKPKNYQRTRDLALKKTFGDPPKPKGDHMNKGEELVSKKVEEFHMALEISQLSPQAKEMIKKEFIGIASKKHIMGNYNEHLRGILNDMQTVDTEVGKIIQQVTEFHKALETSQLSSKTENTVIQRIKIATITNRTSSDYNMHLQGILDKIETMRTEVGKINQQVTEFHEALETSQLPPQAKKLVTEHIDDYISEKLKRGDFREHSQGILDKVKTISKTMGEVVSKVNNGPEKIQKVLKTATLPDNLKDVINTQFGSEREKIQTSYEYSRWEHWESLASDIEDIGELVNRFNPNLQTSVEFSVRQDIPVTASRDKQEPPHLKIWRKIKNCQKRTCKIWQTIKSRKTRNE